MQKIYFIALFLFLSACDVQVGENYIKDSETYPEITENSVFIPEIPKENFENLSLEDFPSFNGGYAKGVALHGEDIFVVADPYLLKYDFDGNLLAYANPKILSCGVEIAVIDDSLFVDCRQEGIFEIDLNKNEIVYNYTEKDGLLSSQNPVFAVQGTTLWMGTFEGIAKIDTESRKVRFYQKELMTDGDTKVSAEVYTNQEQVWATLNANAYNNGGAILYNEAEDSWTQFTPEDFKTTDFERVDFREFIVSSEGIFAVYQDGGPANTVLAKFDPDTNKWEQIQKANYQLDEELKQYLPAKETYTNYELTDYNETGITNLKVYDGTVWREVNIYGVENVAISPLVDDTYYILTNYGIYSFAKADKFPELLINEDFSLGTDRIFASEDQHYILFLTQDIMGMGPVDPVNHLGILDTSNNSFYTIEYGTEEYEESFVINEKTELVQEGNKFYIDLMNGERVILDIETKTLIPE